MINGFLEQFLDTGWYTEAELFYNGYIYWCEANYNSQMGESTFFVDRWSAINEDNLLYRSITEDNGEIQWERVFEYTDKDLDLIKKKFLESKIFDGKSFWEVESEIAWLDYGGTIKKSSLKSSLA